MIKVKEAIIVEGKYDKIKLSSLIDGLIIETNGFRIFKDKEQMAFIRRLADTRGIIVLTDSDSAGFLIRHCLTGAIEPEKIKHAYIPDILGKEKRKDKPSKEGKLGVEGVPAQIIRDALKRAGAGLDARQTAARKPGKTISKADLFLTGLSGTPNSTRKRQALLKALSLPEHLSANSLIQVLNDIMSYDEFIGLTDKL